MRSSEDPAARPHHGARDAALASGRIGAAGTIAAALRDLVDSMAAARSGDVEVRSIMVVGGPASARSAGIERARDGHPTRLHRRPPDAARERTVHEVTTLPAPACDEAGASASRGPRPTPRGADLEQPEDVRLPPTYVLVPREVSAPPGPRTLVPGPRCDEHDGCELERVWRADGEPTSCRRIPDSP
jgi:hypothetical protein